MKTFPEYCLTYIWDIRNKAITEGPETVQFNLGCCTFIQTIKVDL